MDKVKIITPEHIELEFELAGLGSRMVAALVDYLLQFGLVAVIFMALAFSNPALSRDDLPTLFKSAQMAILLVLTFLILTGYFIFFEAIWNGQTPGKKLAQIQVIRDNGQPVAFVESLLRNLLRIVDILPFHYLLGIAFIFINDKNKRIGDIVAKTIVVKLKENLSPTALPELDVKTDLVIDVSQITPEEYSLVRRFLLRRGRLKLESRAKIGKKLANQLMDKAGVDPNAAGPEEFLEALSIEYRKSKKHL